MAIAAVVITHSPQDQTTLQDALGRMGPLLDIRAVDFDKIAATMELPSEELTAFLKKIAALPEALNLELVFVNYEDDLDEDGFIPTPPEARKYD